MTHTGLTTRRIVGAITSKIFPNCVVGPIALLYDPPIPSLTALYPPSQPHNLPELESPLYRHNPI